MTDDEFDPYAGSSGLKDDFDGVIVDAWAELDTQNAGNRTNAWLKILADDGEEILNRYGLGSDWASYDGGETIEHPKGPRQVFNNQTAYQELLKASLASGAEDLMRQRSRESYDGRGPMHMKSWLGLKFHWEVKTETMKFKDRETGEMVERDVNRSLPTKFLGVVDLTGQTGTAQGASATTAPVPASQPAPVPPVPTEGNPAIPTDGPLSLLNSIAPEDAAKAKIAAKSQPYHEWVDTVLSLPGVATDGNLVAALGIEDGLYKSLKES